jgi:hypothetical protein
MGSSPPKPPSPAKQAEAQRQENMWTSQFNTIGSNANQYTPYGSVENTQGAKIPIYNEKGEVTGYGTQWNQTTKLSPEEQKIFNVDQSNRLGLGNFANQQIKTVTDVLGRPFDTKGLPAWKFYDEGPELAQAQYGGTDRAAIEKAIMDSTRRATAPTWAAEDAQLAARGMGAPGSEMAYATGQQRGDVLAEAGRQGYLASGAESRAAEQAAQAKAEATNKVLQQMWLNQNTGVDQSNTIHNAMFGERQQERNQIVNEISALMNGGQVMVPQGQAFQGSQVNPFDIAGAMDRQHQYDMQAYQNKQSGLFGLAGGAMSLIKPFSLFGGA